MQPRKRHSSSPYIPSSMALSLLRFPIESSPSPMRMVGNSLDKLSFRRSKAAQTEGAFLSTKCDPDVQELESSEVLALFPSLDLNCIDHEALPSINLDCLLDASFQDSAD